jgi:hypothetical protein
MDAGADTSFRQVIHAGTQEQLFWWVVDSMTRAGLIQHDYSEAPRHIRAGFWILSSQFTHSGFWILCSVFYSLSAQARGYP